MTDLSSQQQQRSLNAVYLVEDAVKVDFAPVIDSKTGDDEKRAALATAHDTVAQFVKAIGRESGIATIQLSSGYSYDPEMRCYHAMFRPDFRIRAHVLHRDFGYGQTVAMHVADVRKCKYFRNGILDVKGIDRELRWACLEDESKSGLSPTDPVDAIVDVDGTIDKKRWIARLAGKNSFVGLYHYAAPATGDAASATDPMPGLLVVHASSLYNQDRNYDKLLKTTGAGVPTYLEFATDKQQQKLRDLQVRNALRMAHDAMVALGFGAAIAAKTYADTKALPRPFGAQQERPLATDRRSILESVRPIPQLVVPDIHNESDLMVPRSDFSGSNPEAWVSYYDGVVAASKSQATGGFLALKDGNPASGIYHMASTEEYELPYWDGGFCAAKGWKLHPDFEAKSKFYQPIAVVVVSDATSAEEKS